MKKDIHPPYHQNVTVRCACGHHFTTGSTASAIHVEVCAACHPFYTGRAKLVDVAGRVDKFKKRLAASHAKAPTARPKPRPITRPRPSKFIKIT